MVSQLIMNTNMIAGITISCGSFVFSQLRVKVSASLTNVGSLYMLVIKCSDHFNVAKCNLGEVKLKRIGLRLSPIAVRDMRGGPLESCRASLGVCS